MKLLFSIYALLFCISINAQDFDFGKITKEELQEKFNPLDSSASATYLYKYRKTFFEYKQDDGFQQVTEIHERIKIYNKEGYDYATKGVSLYKSGSDREKMTGLKAYTYNLIDDKIEEDKIKKDGIFESEKNEYLNQTKFTLPNIKIGSVIEYEYRIQSPFYSIVDEFEFQHDIPIKKIDAQFEAPEYYNFKLNTKGFLSVIPKIETKRDKITFREKTRTGGEGLSGVSSSVSSSNLEFTKKITSYDLSNIPALKEEPYVNNINNYRSAVKFELSFTKFPNYGMQYYSTTWENVVETIYQSPNFGTELNKTGYFEEDIDALIGGESDPMMRASLIYNFVKAKIKWNEYYSKYTNDGVRKAYKDQVGNVAEINLILTSMLRYAGLDANPVLVSTRNNGIPLFPTREGYNYVISGIETSNGVILLDASSRYSTPNVLPIRTLNWQGRIIRKDESSSLIDLYPTEKSKNNLSMFIKINHDGNLEGSIRTIKTDHNAISYREDYLETDKNQFLEKLENKYNGMEISDFEVKNDLDLSKPIIETYKFIIEDQVDIMGDKIFFSPLFFLKTALNPFKLEKREFPVDFGYPSNNKYIIIINIPEGYKVETVPEPVVLMLPDNLGSYKYNISGNEKGIQLVIETEINQSIISPIHYEAIKAYFSKIVEKEAQQLVLTKV